MVAERTAADGLSRAEGGGRAVSRATTRRHEPRCGGLPLLGTVAGRARRNSGRLAPASGVGCGRRRRACGACRSAGARRLVRRRVELDTRRYLRDELVRAGGVPAPWRSRGLLPAYSRLPFPGRVPLSRCLVRLIGLVLAAAACPPPSPARRAPWSRARACVSEVIAVAPGQVRAEGGAPLARGGWRARGALLARVCASIPPGRRRGPSAAESKPKNDPIVGSADPCAA